MTTNASGKGDVLIVGGGIIGAACALELARRGVKATVIDKGKLGSGSSYGNAGWITPCFALPLPMTGMLFQSIQWLLDPDGPLYIKPRANWDLIRWLTRFAFSMNENRMRESTTALTGLAKYSLESFRQLDAESPGSFGFAQKGLLLVAQTTKGLDAAVAEMDMVAAHGIAGRKLDEAGTRQLEPAITGPVVGSVYFPDEAHAEPLAAVQALMNRAEKLGATFLADTELVDFNIRGGMIESARTTRGTMRADQYVLATGAWSQPIARALGVRIPMLSGKGYAVVVEPFEPKPSIPLMLIERKVAITPRKDSVRIAGTLELVGIDESITARRVDAMVRNARLYLNVPEQPEVVELWRGLRPCTPDGVPVIGRAPRLDNLVIAAGHQMLGLLTAPGTGRLVADIVTGTKPVFDPHPFRVERF